MSDRYRLLFHETMFQQMGIDRRSTILLVRPIGIDRRSTMLLVRPIGIHTAVHYTLSITLPVLTGSHPQLLSTKYFFFVCSDRVRKSYKIKEIAVRERTKMWPRPLDSTTDSDAATANSPLPRRSGGTDVGLPREHRVS